MLWCEPCQSYHIEVQNRQEWLGLKCFAPYKGEASQYGPNAGKAVPNSLKVRVEFDMRVTPARYNGPVQQGDPVLGAINRALASSVAMLCGSGMAVMVHNISDAVSCTMLGDVKITLLKGINDGEGAKTPSTPA